MRRIISFLSAAITAFSLAACSQVDMQHEEELPISEGSVSDNILIAYFSWAENAVLPEGDGEAAMHGLSFRRTYVIRNDMTRFFSAILTGGMAYRCHYSAFWIKTIFQGKMYTYSAPMVPEDLQTV